MEGCQHSTPSVTPPDAAKRTTMNGKTVFTVPAKTVINFKSHFDKKLLCDGMTFSTGSACAYSCSFCYVTSMMLKQQNWLKKHGVTGEHMEHVVRRENPVQIARKQILSKPEAFRQQKQVIYASPLVDVAANMDLVRETVEICKVILELTNWDIRLLSKSNMLPKVATLLELWAYACGKGFDSLQRCADVRTRIIYGVSTGTLDDGFAAAFEQGCPRVSKRIQSLHWLQDNGFRTFGMICPSLPQDDYTRFAGDMAQAIRADRCEHVWAEVINLRGESFTKTMAALEASGLTAERKSLGTVSTNKPAWEEYARQTFEAHAALGVNRGKLRFLQYVTGDTRGWWESRRADGAVIL